MEAHEQGDEIVVFVGASFWKQEQERYFFIGAIVQSLISKLLKNARRPCYYLPAARSGILQGHKALAAGLIRKAPYVGLEPLEIPRLSGVIVEFISTLLNLPDRKGPLYSFAQGLERELIKGEVIARSGGESPYPEIQYSFQATEIPIHRSSSTVSELAPLVLYLKYIVEPNCVLIIEEPEAHLHPQNQRLLAKYLVRLIRKGVNLVLTTHSEFLLEQLNNFILLSRIPADGRASKYEYGKDDFLAHDEVAAYAFSYDSQSNSHRVSQIEVSEEDGISQQEFTKIHETLYEETFKIQQEVGAAT
jgi:predicted ATPase